MIIDNNTVAYTNKEATEYIRGLDRISSVEEGKMYAEDVLLLPKHVDIIVDQNSNIRTIGLEKSRDIKAKDLLRIIHIEDAQNLKYTETNVLSPSVYVHSLTEKPWHITTQGFLITHITSETKRYIESEKDKTADHYGKHELDRFWLPCSKPLESVTDDDLVCVFNRRVSGWDGSMERPVIELLGAGGHLQAIWDDNKKCFSNRSFGNNLKKEFGEEIGLEISDKDIQLIGGFRNDKTQELVVFSCIYINEYKLPDIQRFALNNVAEDTDGIYLGTFTETMKYYKKDPSLFAGGTKAAKTNFPNNEYIIKKICELFSLDEDI